MQRIMSSPPIEPLFYSPSEAMRLLGMKRTKFYAEVGARRLRLVHNGVRSFVPCDDLKSYAASLLNGELKTK